MKTNLWIAVALISAILAGAASSADARGRNLCATEALAGKWMFATGIGRQMLGEPFPPDEDITAIGTWNVDRYGNLEGVFDVTVENFAHLSDVSYTGSIVVNDDCRGTVEFVTSQGTSRMDSITVVSPWEILGMSRDPANLWTYQVRRLPRRFSGGHRN